jgi:hypothetical protein
MGRFEHFLGMVAKSKLQAPNLKEMTLRFYTGNKHGGNAVARDLVVKHLLALRWMNPNAVIYLREVKGQGCPEVDYELCESGAAHPAWGLRLCDSQLLQVAGTPPETPKKTFEIKKAYTSAEVIAKVLMAARDPEVPTPPGRGAAAAAAPLPEAAAATPLA